ncbi:pre-mRNA 3' end processing protein WDR33-like [Panonychus citri]|uniref:pre-mRNA 3' end processing protein WDR33-like n=1 Tax=Panonychus citri TaxID=50023 RepID=UPI00230743F8|nr:pre-mRNA 3' end processing protein WDR33-like [Panonychus citri]XP_053201320.1 pre-mRNA 3' end processing protein WDR33-like [Panonychus citri]
MSNWTPKEGKGGHPPFQPRPPIYQATEFDGKRLRKAIARKTVDYNTSIVNMLETKIWTKNHYDRRAIQPDYGYYPQLLPPMSFVDNPVNCVTTKFVRTSTNKMRCPIFCVLWTPEGRRLVTGASSGEFTLWNGLTFNFETILQAHDSAVRAMVWSSNDMWMVTADQSGNVKYWQSNMNNVKMFHAHDDPIRGVSMSPSGNKFATCSDDGTIKIWDFFNCIEDRTLRGHGSDVKAVDWHPEYDLIVSGSKDSQQPIKLWDSRSGTNLATIHAHKSTVMDVKWNQNGNWLLTASRDHLIKIFDIRNVTTEMQVFRGHKKEACCLAWHPVHESLFASGGSDGSILFWLVGTEKEVGGMELAHDSVVWSLSWHPLGHILASGSNDHTCKFWTRNRPGDRMGDKYNLNIMKGQEEVEYDEVEPFPSIPGITRGENEEDIFPEEMVAGKSIPGLGLPVESNSENKSEEGGEQQNQRKVPFSKPVPKEFANQWSDRKSHSVIAPSNEIDRQYNPDHHHPHHMNSNSSQQPNHLPPNQPPNGPPYIHGPPPMGPPHQYPPGPPLHPMDHPMDGPMGYGGPPVHGPMHGPGPSGPNMPPGGPPSMPPHMRRDDMPRGGNDYHYNMHNERYHQMPPPHSMPPHHPKDKFSHRNQHPPSHSPPPMGSGGNMYNDMPGPDYHRRDMRWREDDYNRGRDEDFRRHNYEPRGPGCEPPWRRPPPPPDEYHWRPNYPQNDVRWRRDMRGGGPPNDQRWDWDRQGDHHRQAHH